MILHQGNKSIEFTIVNYQYPEKRPSKEGFDYDANWLMCEVKYSDAETNETYKDAYLLTDELADMVEELSEIIDGSEDGYISDFMESGGIEKSQHYCRRKRQQKSYKC